MSLNMGSGPEQCKMGKPVSSINQNQDLVPAKDLAGCWCCYGILCEKKCGFGWGCYYKSVEENPIDGPPDTLRDCGCGCFDCLIPCPFCNQRHRIQGTNTFVKTGDPTGQDTIVFTSSKGVAKRGNSTSVTVKCC